MPDRRRFLRGIAGAGASLASASTRRALVALPGGAALPAPVLVDVRGPVLGPLLARNRERYPGASFGANHTSMAVLALAALGGAPDQLAQVGAAMLRGGTPFPEGGGAIEAPAWRASLGNLTAMAAFRRLFAAEVARRGVAGTLRIYLPELFRGMAAAEFHCMIRTAYAVRFGDPDEVAVGLAYWASVFLPLGPLLPPGRELDPVACLAGVRARMPLDRVESLGRGPAGRMKWLATLPAFPAVASTLRVDDRSLARISRAMVRMLAADDADFLHAVTGTHAFRTLEPYVADRNTARRYLWQALVAYALVQRAPDALGARLPARLPAWPEIIATAIADGGDHGLKLTYSALEEDLAYRDDHYRLVVARRLKLV